MVLSWVEGTLEVSVNCFRSVSTHTRRRAVASFAASLGALAAAPLTRAQSQASTAQEPAITEKPALAANAARTAIHYEIEFSASPQRFYQAILDEKQFTAFTGLATNNPIPGGAFSQFGGLMWAATSSWSPTSASSRHGAPRTGMQVYTPLSDSN
jgi:activator of HSP90 ATPase